MSRVERVNGADIGRVCAARPRPAPEGARDDARAGAGVFAAQNREGQGNRALGVLVPSPFAQPGIVRPCIHPCAYARLL